MQHAANLNLSLHFPFQWSQKHTEAFQALKTALSTAPVLRHPDYDRPFIVVTDASDVAIGATLMQNYEDGRHPVAFEGRKLRPAELNYPAHEKEQLAVVYAVEKWRCYLEGKTFTVLTDNRAVVYLKHKLVLGNRRLARWQLALSGYDFEFKHMPGPKNQSDPISRRPDLCPLMVFRTDEDWTEAYNQDPLYQDENRPVTFHRQGHHWFQGDRICVPDNINLRQRMLHESHATPLSGHLGRDKTYDRCSRRFYWPQMHDDVRNYVAACKVCQQLQPATVRITGAIGDSASPVGRDFSGFYDRITKDFIRQ